MRDAALWAAGAALAFVVTAGAFLMLANLATGPSAEDVPANPARGPTGPALDLDLNRERLASLKPRVDQELLVVVENAGDQPFSSVNLTIESATGDTANPETRYYRRTVEDLEPDEGLELRFPLDLSSTTGASAAPTASEQRTRILEIRATTPEGVSEVRTAILPM